MIGINKRYPAAKAKSELRNKIRRQSELTFLRNIKINRTIRDYWMGYETNFTLNADSRHEDINFYLKTVAEPHSYLANLDYYPNSKDWYVGDCKWYDHDDDVKVLSAQFPDVVFTLFGVGEEYPDIWRKFYQNGEIVRKQKAVITFEDENGKSNSLENLTHKN